MSTHVPEAFLAKVPFYRRVWPQRLPDYEKWFRRYNFFDVISLDTGTYFDFIETGLDDRKIADSVIEGTCLKPWGGVLGDLDFNATKTYEQVGQSLWIQSFYVVSPIARAWRQTGEKKYLEAFRKYFFDWYRKNSPPKNMAVYLREEKEKMLQQTRCRGPVDRSWFDFDPAARALYLSWALFFIGAALSDEEYATSLASLCDHAQALLANFANWPDMPGNHQCLWSLALFYLGYLLREEAFSSPALRVGAAMLSRHFKGESIFSDGSPSYMFFSLMHFRDGWALARRNGGTPPVPQAALEKMHETIFGIVQPDGTVPALNDGFAADAHPILEIGAQLFKRPDWIAANNEPSRKKPLVLPNFFNESGFAVARTGRKKDSAYVILDATRPLSLGKATHAHAGKLGFVYWARGKQLVGDSGVGPYSEPLFGQWYRRARAHSTIMVDGREDADFIAPWEWDHLPKPAVCDARAEQDYVLIHAKSDGFMRLTDPVAIERRLCLLPDGTLIVWDSMHARSRHRYDFIFRLTGGKAQGADGGVTVRYPSRNVPRLQIVILNALPKPVNVRQETGPYYFKTGAKNTPTVIFSTEATGPLNMAFGIVPREARRGKNMDTIKARLTRILRHERLKI